MAPALQKHLSCDSNVFFFLKKKKKGGTYFFLHQKLLSDQIIDSEKFKDQTRKRESLKSRRTDSSLVTAAQKTRCSARRSCLRTTMWDWYPKGARVHSERKHYG